MLPASCRRCMLRDARSGNACSLRHAGDACSGMHGQECMLRDACTSLSRKSASLSPASPGLVKDCSMALRRCFIFSTCTWKGAG